MFQSSASGKDKENGMKMIFFLVLFLTGCGNAFAEKVRVYTDYSPVRILKLIDENADFDAEAGKSGLKGNFKVIDSSEIPNDRVDRDAWKMKNGAISADPQLKADIAIEEKKRTDAIEKLKVLGLTDEDIKILF